MVPDMTTYDGYVIQFDDGRYLSCQKGSVIDVFDVRVEPSKTKKLNKAEIFDNAGAALIKAHGILKGAENYKIVSVAKLKKLEEEAAVKIDFENIIALQENYKRIEDKLNECDENDDFMKAIYKRELKVTRRVTGILGLSIKGINKN